MKTKLLILFLLSYTISYGHQYESLVVTNKLWSTLYESYQYPVFTQKTSFDKFSGDTLIGSHHFMKVFEAKDSLQQNYVELGYVREDTAHKVFFRNLHDTTIFLMYDFNAHVGEYLIIWGQTLVVNTIDSIYIYDHYMRRFVLTPQFGGPQEIWIEGIGSMYGLMRSGTSSTVGASYYLLCYFENSIIKYHRSGYSKCYYDYVGINEPEPDKVSVSIIPNPVTSTSVLNIESKQEREYLLEIYSILGGTINTFVIPKTKQAYIHKSDYARGLYMYRLRADDSKVMVGKFVVQ